MGKVYDKGTSLLPLINIDHHVTNTLFGTVNWVDPTSVSTTQMILELADALDWKLTQQVAACLLTGLVTDTRSFRTSNVDARAMRAALRLMEAGASLSETTRRSLDQRPLSLVRLWGEAIGDIHLEGDILWTGVTRKMRRRWVLAEDGTAGLTNMLSGVREANVVIVFTERDDGTVDVGMRAAPGYNVADVALKLGGGGHPQASGCTLEGGLADVKDRVLGEVRSSLDDQHGTGGRVYS
jgi:phosphoesterase RecJ-like protein